MTIYNLYIFDRYGECLVFRHWHQAPLTEKAIINKCKLTFGLLYTLKAFCNKLSPRKLEGLQNEHISSYSTATYKLHYLETLTGLRIALVTDLKASTLNEILAAIYQLFSENIVRTL